MCAEVARIDAEDVVTDLEFADSCADCFDLSSQLAAEDLLRRSQESFEEAARRHVRVAEAGDERLGAANPGVCPGDRRGVDLDEDFVVLGDGRSTSWSRGTSGGPYLSWTTALMRSRPLNGSLHAMDRAARVPRPPRR